MRSKNIVFHPFRFAAALFAALTLCAASALAQEPVLNKEYMRLKNPIPVETGKNIEVIEFFSYGCPHCADFEPIVQTWLKTIPPDVQFRRVPVMFQERWIPLAKIYYTLEALGEESRLTAEVFGAIHGKGINLSNEKAFFDWAATKGLDRKKVEDVYNSFAINGKINRAKQLAQQYNVQSVPMVFVDGKFMTETSMVGTHTGLPPVMNGLIAKARAERKS